MDAIENGEEVLPVQDTRASCQTIADEADPFLEMDSD